MFFPSRGSGYLRSLKFGGSFSCLVEWERKELAFRKINNSRKTGWLQSGPSSRQLEGSPYCGVYSHGGHLDCESINLCRQPTHPTRNSEGGWNPFPLSPWCPPEKPLSLQHRFVPPDMRWEQGGAQVPGVAACSHCCQGRDVVASSSQVIITASLNQACRFLPECLSVALFLFPLTDRSCEAAVVVISEAGGFTLTCQSYLGPQCSLWPFEGHVAGKPLRYGEVWSPWDVCNTLVCC